SRNAAEQETDYEEAGEAAPDTEQHGTWISRQSKMTPSSSLRLTAKTERGI
ncbi:Hypothetical predicted protein, partial [Pelobates cultripes]